MATYQVTGPNGERYEVEGPDGASEAEVLAQVQGQASAKPRTGGTGIAAIDRPISSVNEFLLGVPKGLYNLGSAATDAVLEPFVGSEAIEGARQQRAGAFDAVSRTFSPVSMPDVQTAGEIASTLPFAELKIGGKLANAAPEAVQLMSRGQKLARSGITAANRAFQGAIGGAAARDMTAGPGATMALGAGINVVAPPVIGAIVNKVAGSRPAQWAMDRLGPVAGKAMGAIDDIGEGAYNFLADKLGRPALPKVPPLLPTPVTPAQTVQQALGPKAAARMRNFQALGVKSPTTAMVTRDPAAWTFERETSKNAEVGGDLVGQFQQVANDLDRAAANLVRSRGTSTDPETVGRGVQGALEAKNKEMQSAVSSLYTQVREKRGDQAAGALDTFLDLVDMPDFTDNPKFDAVRTALMRRLGRFGMTGESGLVRKGAQINITQAEELRKFIGELGDATDPSIRFIRGRLINALDDDVVNAVGSDPLKVARQAAMERFAEFKKTFAGKVADEGIAPEMLVARVMGKGTPLSDVRAMRDTLLKGTPEQVARGKQAWAGVGAQAIDDLFAGARNADGILSGARLNKAFVQSAAKLRLLLDPSEYRQLQRIAIAARDSNTAPAFSAVNNSNTASAMANMFNPESPVGKSLIRNLGEQGLAFLGMGPAGNVALKVGKDAAAATAAQRQARDLIKRVQMAKSPDAAAAALKEMQRRASRNATIRNAVQRWQDGGFYSSFAALKPRTSR